MDVDRGWGRELLVVVGLWLVRGGGGCGCVGAGVVGRRRGSVVSLVWRGDVERT